MLKRQFLFVIFVILLLVTGCSQGPPAQVAGNWSGGYDLTAVVTKVELTLEQKGDELTGQYQAYEMASQTGLSGAVMGKVSGPNVTLDLVVPEELKTKRGWSDLEMKLILTEEDGQPVLKGWTHRYEKSVKQRLETLLSR